MSDTILLVAHSVLANIEAENPQGNIRSGDHERVTALDVNVGEILKDLTRIAGAEEEVLASRDKRLESSKKKDQQLENSGRRTNKANLGDTASRGTC